MGLFKSQILKKRLHYLVNELIPLNSEQHYWLWFLSEFFLFIVDIIEVCVFSFEVYVPLYNLIQCKDDFAPC